MSTRSRIAALLVGAGVALAGCADSDPGPDDPSPATASEDTATSSPSDDASSAGSSSDTSPSDASPSKTASSQSATVTVPVYFAGDTPQGTRLYREFRRVDAADPLDAALTLVASGDALDPDYRTLLPAGEFTGSTYDAGASVRLPDDSWTRRPAGMSRADSLLAIQQLVYTAQGVLQQRMPITFTDSDGNATQIFGVASEDGFRAAEPLDTLALMSVTTPETGQQVTGTLQASGVGSSFEATVPWEIRDSAGKRVKRGFTTADGWMDRLYPWRAAIDVSGLEPGDYTFVASTDDPSDGEGGGPTVDTKEFTIR